jgi:hypothetical protein
MIMPYAPQAPTAAGGRGLVAARVKFLKMMIDR